MRKLGLIITATFFAIGSLLSILFCVLLEMPAIYAIGMIAILLMSLPVFWYFANKMFLKNRPKNKDFANIEIPGFDGLHDLLIEEFENDMKKLRNNYILTKIARIIILPIFLFSIAISEGDIIFISRELTVGIVASMIPLGVLYVLTVMINLDKREKYRKLYKRGVIPKLINLIDPFLVYKTSEIDMYSTEREYKNSEFDDEKNIKLLVDDYVEGSINNNKFIEISEIDTWIPSARGRKFENVFNGIFAYATTDTFVDGIIKIHKPDTPVNEKFKKIQINNKEFENYFDVYTTNELITKIILYDGLTEKLVELKKKFGLTYEIVLKGNDIYIRIYSGEMFEPNLYGKPMDRKLLLKYYTLIKFTIELANELNAKLPQKESEEENI